MEIRPVSVVRIRWDHRGAAPLTRLELHRLVRTPRVRAGWAAAAVLVVAGLGWMAVTNPENRPTVGSFVVVPMMIAVAHVTLISRGLSPRPAPPQLVIGLRPFGWASALVVASAALATSLAVPVLVALTALTRSLQVGAFVLGLEVFVLALSAVLGSILLPGSENKGGEAAGLFLTGIIASVLVFAVGQAVGDLQGVGVWFLATGVCLLTVPGLVETFRWSYATVGRAPRLKWWGGTD